MSVSRSLTLITGNQAKARQIARFIQCPLRHKKLDLHEIQSLDQNAIIIHKAEEAYRLLRSPVLVDDVSLTFQVWGKLPGPLIKWFIEEMGIAGICRLLDPYKNRLAVATVTFGLRDKRGVHIFSASLTGEIAHHPVGERGFGWNPIFIPKGSDITWAQMTLYQQDQLPFRRIALAKLDRYLTRHPI